MLFIGHRGAPSLEPENTIRSFKKAQELGVDMIEFDVRLSKDEQIVVSHDSDLKRLFGVDKNITDLTVNELKSITGGEKEIPTLEEVLASVSVPIIVHIKVHGLEQQLVAKLKSFSSKVLISAAYPGILKKIRALDENVELGLIIRKGELHLFLLLPYLTKNLNLHSIHPSLPLVSRPTIALIRGISRRKIFVWNVDTLAEYSYVSKLKIDGVFTNHPELIKK